MTVTNTATKVAALGNGATTVWPFTFPIPGLGDIVVSLVDFDSGDAIVVDPVNYSVTGLGNPNGGSVTYPLTGSPLTSATYLLIERLLPLTQTTSYANQGAVYPQTIEDSLDDLTMIVQQQQDALNRAIIFSAVDDVEQVLPPASARANLFLGFDASGGPIAVGAITPDTTVSAAMVPVVTAPTTADALAALGIPGALLNALIPAGTVWDYSLPDPPPGFIFPYAQPCTALYPTYRAALIAAGFPYGTDGTDPLMPDLRSRVVAGKSDMGGTDNTLLTGGTVLGVLLGNQNRVILTSNLPASPPTGTISATAKGSVRGTNSVAPAIGASSHNVGGTGNFTYYSSDFENVIITATFTGANLGTATPMSIVQPTIILNKIIKVH